MTYTQVIPEEVNKFYKTLVIVDALYDKCNVSDDALLLFTTKIAEGILKLSRPAEYNDDLYKLELCHCIEYCAAQPKNKELFGLPWFSKSHIFLQIIEIMSESVLKK